MGTQSPKKGERCLQTELECQRGRGAPIIDVIRKFVVFLCHV